MRPTNLLYSVHERPPTLICLVNAAQQLVVIMPAVIFVVLIGQGSGANEATVANAISLALMGCAVGTLLQIWPGRWTGSGYLIAICPAAPYVPLSIAALNTGGPALLAGMTIIAGLFQIAFAQLSRHLRPFFPAEISGLCILLIGLFVGVLGMRAIFGINPAMLEARATLPELILSSVTLALMIGLNLWGNGIARMLCAIIGAACGYLAAVLLGLFDQASMRTLADASWLGFPQWSPQIPTVSADLVVPFMAVALTCALRVMGDISMAQKINDRNWIRPDMTSIRKGIVADGLATMLSGLAGSIGGNTQSSSIGVSNATGVTARRVGYWLAGMLVVLSMLPVVSATLVAMPRPVIGALLLFTSTFIITSGLQVITSRLLDQRRTFIIGLALIVGLSREIFPFAFERLPAALQPIASPGLILGSLIALTLNALFRIGVRTRASIDVHPRLMAHEMVRVFFEQQGAVWGARRDVIERTIFGTEQSLESMFAHCNVEGAVNIEASFDEFNLDIRISYAGEEFTLSGSRPTEEEILASDDGLRLLAGYLVQRNADHVHTSRRGDRAILEFHFQH